MLINLIHLKILIKPGKEAVSRPTEVLSRTKARPRKPALHVSFSSLQIQHVCSYSEMSILHLKSELRNAWGQ